MAPKPLSGGACAAAFEMRGRPVQQVFKCAQSCPKLANKNWCRGSLEHSARRLGAPGDMDHPLIAAVKRGDVAEVIRARDACVDLGVVRSPNTENTALHIAAALGNVAVLLALVPAPEKRTSAWHVDVRNKQRDTPLMHALARGHSEAASCLLDAGAMVESANEERSTALHYAASSGETKCVRLVLAKKNETNETHPDVERANRFGRTALHYAACVSSVGCVEVLLEAGASPFARNAKGEVPAAEAEREGHAETGKALQLAMRVAEERAAAVAASLAEEDSDNKSSTKPSTSNPKLSKKKKKGFRVKIDVASGHVERGDADEEDVALAVAPRWAAAFAAHETVTETEKNEEPAAAVLAAPPKPEKIETSRSGSDTTSVSAVCESFSTTSTPAPAPAPAPSSQTKSWAFVATEKAFKAAPVKSAETVKVSEPAARKFPTVSQPSSSTVVSWEHEAKARLDKTHPTASGLRVKLKNLLGIGVEDMSASQLEAAEDVHKELLNCLVDARVELARATERARLEELAAIERVVTRMANSGVR